MEGRRLRQQNRAAASYNIWRQLCAGSAQHMHAGSSLVHGVAVVPEV